MKKKITIKTLKPLVTVINSKTGQEYKFDDFNEAEVFIEGYDDPSLLDCRFNVYHQKLIDEGLFKWD